MPRPRVDLHGLVTPVDIADLVNDPTVQVVQTDKPLEPSAWRLLNSELFSARPDITLRVYGFYQEVCDLSFLQDMGHVRHFAADCLMKATGIEYVGRLLKLESLSVGIYGLDSFGFLDSLPREQITKLSLLATGSKRPNLQLLGRFNNLATLYIEGHQKDIEVLGGLENLEDLTLRSIGQIDLGLLQRLRRLWSLDIKLGGCSDLSGLSGLSQIKYLELWQIKGLSDISVISTLPSLQFLYLQSLVNVAALPDFSGLKHLRRVCCENMNGLTDVTSLSSATALEEFFFSKKNGLTPEAYEWIVKLPGIRSATVALGRMKVDDRFRELATIHGVEPYQFRRFEFTQS